MLNTSTGTTTTAGQTAAASVEEQSEIVDDGILFRVGKLSSSSHDIPCRTKVTVDVIGPRWISAARVG